MTDMINNPPHYKDESGIECIEITRHMGFCGGNCFKYLYRAGKKGDLVEDLNKALKYAEWAAENEEPAPRCISLITKVVASRRECDRCSGASSAMEFIAQGEWISAWSRIETAIRELDGWAVKNEVTKTK